MNSENKIIGLRLFLITFIFICFIFSAQKISAAIDNDGPSIERLQEKIQNHLYDRYGEDFEVDRMDIQYGNITEYVARIYPASIIGTYKEGDPFYYAGAGVEKLPKGRLGEVWDTYKYINRSIDLENYLLPSAKEIFGERILLKIEVQNKVTEDGTWWDESEYVNLNEMRRAVQDNPEKNRIELSLDIYIFDRLDDKSEKEERQRQIFEYIKYLNKEGLYKYLDLGVIFIDERVLAPDFNYYRNSVKYGDRFEEVVEDELVYLPAMELRQSMSEILDWQLSTMSEEEILESIQMIRRDDLYKDGINKDNTQASFHFFSPGFIAVEHMGLEGDSIEEEDFIELEDIQILYDREYIYLGVFWSGE